MVERKRLPTLPIAPKTESLCESCNGACCQAGALIGLSDVERDFLAAGGTELVKTSRKTRGELEAEMKAQFAKLGLENIYVYAEGPDNPEYALLTDCGYLERTVGQMAICTVYNNPNKPYICNAFEPGSTYCYDFRRERGVDPA